MRHTLQSVLLSVVLMIFWVACVADLQPHDMMVGAAAVAGSVVFSLFVIRTLPLQFRPSISQLGQVWRLPWYIVVDVVQIVRVLLLDLAGKPAPSLFRATDWRLVENNGRETASRALAVALTTVSPNMVVIGIDCKRRQMLFHQLRASGIPKMTRLLGAGEGR